jgi:hypothetical protein
MNRRGSTEIIRVNFLNKDIVLNRSKLLYPLAIGFILIAFLVIFDALIYSKREDICAGKPKDGKFWSRAVYDCA